MGQSFCRVLSSVGVCLMFRSDWIQCMCFGQEYHRGTVMSFSAYCIRRCIMFIGPTGADVNLGHWAQCLPDFSTLKLSFSPS